MLVEDSESLQRSLSIGLKNSGYVVDQAMDGEAAYRFIRQVEYDLIIMDLMLPRLSGLDLLKRIRKEGNTSFVLILSARDQTEDRISGLDLGADDYLVKPFSFDELLSRLRAVTRRGSRGNDGVVSHLSVGDLQIDLGSRTVSWQREPIDLTRSEQSILELLMRRRGRVFSHEQLIDQLYSVSDQSVSRNAIEVHISALRRKLKRVGADDIVRNRRGFGYFIDS